jgi:hypothetical protein
MTVLLALLVPASAQDFPPDPAWVPLPCSDGVMTDAYRDEAGAADERDLVGDADGPTGLRAIDADFAYFRMRLDQDPLPGGVPRPFAWGIELDSDGDRTTYEVLILVNGLDDAVFLYANTEVTLPDDPADPPDEVPLAEHPIAGFARTVTAAGSSWGGDPDVFLEVAVPWVDLARADIFPFTPLVAWYATSSTDTSLNGDFSCHDGSSGDDPSLSDSDGPGTVLDPDADSDGDGFSDVVELAEGSDPMDGGSVPAGVDPDAPLLEGGGGCRSAPVAAPPWLVAALLLARRRRDR